MEKMKFLLLIFTLTPLIYASDYTTAQLTKSLNIFAGSKAIVQWERVFQSERKMKRYKINTLSSEDKDILKKYLIKHAIDSDQPIMAGV